MSLLRPQQVHNLASQVANVVMPIYNISAGNVTSFVMRHFCGDKVQKLDLSCGSA